MGEQLFLSHTWRYDELHRDTHSRVAMLGNLLKTYGWTIWLDEDHMCGNMDSVMTNGIRNADVFLACLTKKYIEKINRASENSHTRDNCFKEWTFANSMNKCIIPIILEPDVLTMTDKGILDLVLGNTFYIDLSKNITKTTVKKLHDIILKHNLTPRLPKNTHKKPLHNLFYFKNFLNIHKKCSNTVKRMSSKPKFNVLTRSKTVPNFVTL